MHSSFAHYMLPRHPDDSEVQKTEPVQSLYDFLSTLPAQIPLICVLADRIDTSISVAAFPYHSPVSVYIRSNRSQDASQHIQLESWYRFSSPWPPLLHRKYYDADRRNPFSYHTPPFLSKSRDDERLAEQRLPLLHPNDQPVGSRAKRRVFIQRKCSLCASPVRALSSYGGI